MSFGGPERNGLSVGVGSWATLSAGNGAGGRNRRAVDPTLIIDFVPTSPVFDYTLSADFTTSSYDVYTADPATTPAIVIIKVWE